MTVLARQVSRRYDVFRLALRIGTGHQQQPLHHLPIAPRCRGVKRRRFHYVKDFPGPLSMSLRQHAPAIIEISE
jgi:hypothetical protein